MAWKKDIQNQTNITDKVTPLQTEDSLTAVTSNPDRRIKDEGFNSAQGISPVSSGKGVIIERWMTEYTILPDGRKFGRTWCMDKQVRQFNKEKAKKPKQPKKLDLKEKEVIELE